MTDIIFNLIGKRFQVSRECFAQMIYFFAYSFFSLPSLVSIKPPLEKRKYHIMAFHPEKLFCQPVILRIFNYYDLFPQAGITFLCKCKQSSGRVFHIYLFKFLDAEGIVKVYHHLLTEAGRISVINSDRYYVNIKAKFIFGSESQPGSPFSQLLKAFFLNTDTFRKHNQIAIFLKDLIYTGK